MARDPVSDQVLRFLHDVHRAGRPAWSNFATITAGAQYRHLHRLCREWIPRGGRVLDWGSGNGHASIYLSRAGYATTGYSLDGFYFADLLDGSAYEFVAADPADPVRLPFGDGRFDAVLSVGVLEHVRETGGEELGSLLEIRRVLKPGGVLICVHLPNSKSWIEGIARLCGVKGHEYRFSLSEVREMFVAAGFRIERQGRYGALPRNRIGQVLTRRLCDSEAFSYFYDGVDWLGGAILPWFVQNHFVVARSPLPNRRPAKSSPESQA